jgi:FG-GAP-like repeat/Bacterial Ig-like domain (group 3)
MLGLRLRLLTFAFLATPLLAQVNSIPYVNQPLVPASVPPGGSAFTLSINGAGFVPGSIVRWNGSDLPTTFLSALKLSATVPAKDIVTFTTANVTVFNPAPGGGISNVIAFTVTLPTSTLKFSQSTIGVGLAPGNVVTADFNHDGKADLAVINTTQPDPSCYPFDGRGTVTILLGDGKGNFSKKSTVCTSSFDDPSTGSAMAVGDFNGDGYPDLIISPFQPEEERFGIEILLGNGDGTFRQGSSFYFNADQLGPIVVGDFNGDGKLDLAFAFEADLQNDSLGALFGNGDGTFGNGGGTFRGPGAANFCGPAHGCRAFGLVTGDFNGDGILDFATAATEFDGTEFTGPFLSVLLGKGNGEFIQNTQVLLTGPTSLTSGDFDGDGKLDIAIADGGATLKVFHGNGDGTFSLIGNEPPAPPSPNTVAAFDINGDGKLDLIFSNGGGTITTMVGNGDGTFQPGIAPPGGNGVVAFAVGDFNRDGHLDIAFPDSLDTISILKQVVPKANTHCQISATPVYVKNQLRYQLSAVVSAKGQSPGIPTGTVKFWDSAYSQVLLGSAPLSNGKATITVLLDSAPSPQWVKAAYGGDTNFNTCNSPYVAVFQ